MTEKPPKTDPDQPTDETDRRLEEDSDAAKEPDLLSANLDALMAGTETPVTEPIDLDEYPYNLSDEPGEPVGTSYPSVEDPLDPIEDTSVPVSEAEEFFKESEDLDAAPSTVIDQPDAPLIELGFYGKLPTYGDFIQKRLPQDFINPWHEWVQAGMLACREQNPEGWMPYYLNCPAWCFVLGGGMCGEEPVAGVTIPSVDRVGRYFNFTMASILPADTDPAVFAGARHNWFEALEVLALAVLDEELDQDGIDRLINEHSAELSRVPAFRPVFESGENHTRIASDDAGRVIEFLPALLHQLIARDHDRYGLWWHRGSSQATAQLISCARMPVGGTYLSLIMDKELRDAPRSASQESGMDYLDELLSG